MYKPWSPLNFGKLPKKDNCVVIGRFIRFDSRSEVFISRCAPVSSHRFVVRFDREQGMVLNTMRSNTWVDRTAYNIIILVCLVVTTILPSLVLITVIVGGTAKECLNVW